MGTYANTDPQWTITCEILGLDTVSTQVISRDRHADYVQTSPWWGPHWALLHRDSKPPTHRRAGSGGELRQGPEGQLRHAPRRNPIRSERISGLAWCCAATPLLPENVALWHERDISHSSTER